MTDSLNRLQRLEQPLTVSPRERRCGIVIRTDERAEMHEHVVTPDKVGETKVEAPPLARDEAVASPDLALDVGQNLSPLVVKAQRTRRAGKSFTVKVPQQIVDGRRPWVTYSPNCLSDSNDSRVRTAVEGSLWLNHASHTPASADHLHKSVPNRAFAPRGGGEVIFGGAVVGRSAA